MRQPYHVKMKVDLDILVVADSDALAEQLALAHAAEEFQARGPILTDRLKNVCDVTATPITSKAQLAVEFPMFAETVPWGDNPEELPVESLLPSPLQVLANIAGESDDMGSAQAGK